MARVLAVGIVTLDIVSEVESYPSEDTEVRACAQSFRRGGNATNSLVVLRQLGHDGEWAGVWRDGPEAAPVLEDLGFHGIGMRYCRKVVQGNMPVSCITLNATTGTRTIVHYRDLPVSLEVEKQRGDIEKVFPFAGNKCTRSGFRGLSVPARDF